MRQTKVELIAPGLAPSRRPAQRLTADGVALIIPSAPGTTASFNVATQTPDWAGNAHGIFDALITRATPADAHPTSAYAPTGGHPRNLRMATADQGDCLSQVGAVRGQVTDVAQGPPHPKLAGGLPMVCSTNPNLRDNSPDLFSQQARHTPRRGFDQALAGAPLITLTKVSNAPEQLATANSDALLFIDPRSNWRLRTAMVKTAPAVQTIGKALSTQTTGRPANGTGLCTAFTSVRYPAIIATRRLGSIAARLGRANTP